MLAALILFASASRSTAVQTAPAQPPGWSPAVAPLLETYRSDDWDALRDQVRRLLEQNPPPAVQRDVRTLLAMAELRSPARENRIAGRSLLLDLAARDARLLDRPDTLLAYGIAQRELHETRSALTLLTRAADLFQKAGRSDSLAATLVALARTWAVHGEWEQPPRGLNIPHVESPDAQQRIREQQLAALRYRAAALPDGGETVRRIDLVRARLLLREGQTDTALELLETITNNQHLTPATSEAGLVLAEQYTAQHRFRSALELFDRIAAARFGDLSERARKAAGQLRRPQLSVDVPASLRPDEPFTSQVAMRNVGPVSIEIRRVNLADWLAHQNGRLIEAHLPAAGSVVMTRTLEPASKPLEAARTTLNVDGLPAGSFVFVARSRTRDGKPVVRKRLVCVSRLSALVLTGPDQGLIWVVGAKNPTARFWMFGTMVPVRPAFTGPLARFALPPERQLLRDRRWVCLVESDGQVTICRGRLTAGEQPTAAAALLCGAPRIHAGERLRLFGLLSWPADGPPLARPSAIQVRMLDVADVLRGSATVPLRPDGSFMTSLATDASLAGETLHFVAAMDDKVLPPAYRPARVKVIAPDAAVHQVHIDAPGWLPSDTSLIEVTTRAAYPWGLPASHAKLVFNAYPVRLPTNDPATAASFALPYDHIGRLRDDGAWDSAIAIKRFDLPPGPLAVLLRSQVRGWDHRLSEGTRSMLVGPRPAHIWIEWDDMPLRVGQRVPLRVQWFDPLGLAATSRPTLEIRGAKQPATHPAFVPTPAGLTVDNWVPETPGDYELIAKLDLQDGTSTIARDHLYITDDAPGARLWIAQATAEVDGDHVVVHADLRGSNDQPALLVLEAGNPVAEQTVAPGQGRRDVRFDLLGGLPERGALRLIRHTGRQFELGPSVAIASNEKVLTLQGRISGSTVAPGARVDVDVQLAAPQAHQFVSILARLIRASDGAAVPRASRQAAAVQETRGDATGVWASTALPVVRPSENARYLSAETTTGMFEGQTLWLDSRWARAPTALRLRVPLPEQPGRYDLVLAARTADGLRRVTHLPIDTRAAVVTRIDLAARMLVGDRTTGAVTLENHTPGAVEAALKLDLGSGLALVGLRAADDPAQRMSADSPLRLTLPAGATRRLYINFEASSPGIGLARLSVDAAGQSRVATARYRISAPADQASDTTSPLLVRRLYRVERAADATPPAAEQLDSVERWLGEQDDLLDLQRVQIVPGESVAPGQMLVVEEELTLADDLPRLTWDQAMPANCITYDAPDDALRAIGRRTQLALGSMRFESDPVSAGRHIHEYVIVTARPGACLFPLPSIKAGGRVVPLASNTTELRVVVRASDK